MDRQVGHDRRLDMGLRALQHSTVVMARPMKTSVEPAALDRFTQAVGRELDVPVVCLSLMDGDSRLVTSTVGVAPSIALLVSWSFTRQVVASGQPFLVTDGRSDPRVVGNPAVRDGTVTAYVGMRLVATDGSAVGTLSAMDRKPRRWTPPQLEFMREICTRVVGEMETRTAARDLTGSSL